MIEYITAKDGTKHVVLRRDYKTRTTLPCPFCHKKHAHGWGIGQRVPHCDVVLHKEVTHPDGTILKHSDGYVIFPVGFDLNCYYDTEWRSLYNDNQHLREQ